MRPRILMFASINDEMMLSMGYQYSRAIERAGGLPTVAPHIEDREALRELINSVDGVVFTGGVDVDPAAYGEEKSEKCGSAQKYRDELEIVACGMALDADKSILGVCRGTQLINVALGGTLYQDIPSELGTDIAHVQAEPKDSYSHSVNVVADTPFADIAGEARVRANSFHHQAIKKLGDGLVPMAFADDGIVEAVYSPTARYLRAYQWHPERLVDIDEVSRKLFCDFVDACADNKKFGEKR